MPSSMPTRRKISTMATSRETKVSAKMPRATQALNSATHTATLPST